MTKVVTGNFAVEIGNPANANAYGSFVVTQADANTITLHYASVGVDTHYYGNFLYDGTGNLGGGTVTGYDQVLNGQIVATASELSLSAVQVANLILSGQSGQLLTLALGGSDCIYGGSFDDKIYAGAGNDVVIALDGYDSVDGQAGDDDVNGNMGSDTVHGGTGNDTVRGGQGADTIFGDDGNDGHVNGNLGDDNVFGGNGNDTCYGGQGSDTVSGDAGNDVISGDLGTDVLFGGAGADTFVFRPGAGVDLVGDFSAAEGDRVLMPTGTAYSLETFQGYAVVNLGNGEVIGLFGVSLAQLSGYNWLVFG